MEEQGLERLTARLLHGEGMGGATLGWCEAFPACWQCSGCAQSWLTHHFVAGKKEVPTGCGLAGELKEAPNMSLATRGGITFAPGDEMGAERAVLCGAEGGAQGNTKHTPISYVLV